MLNSCTSCHRDRCFNADYRAGRTDHLVEHGIDDEVPAFHAQILPAETLEARAHVSTLTRHGQHAIHLVRRLAVLDWNDPSLIDPPTMTFPIAYQGDQQPVVLSNCTLRLGMMTQKPGPCLVKAVRSPHAGKTQAGHCNTEYYNRHFPSQRHGRSASKISTRISFCLLGIHYSEALHR